MSDDDEGKPSPFARAIDRRLEEQRHEAEKWFTDRATSFGPMPSGEWLRQHREQVVSDSYLRDARTSAEMLVDIDQIAKRAIEAFSALPCKGALEQVGDCADSFALTCERRTSPSCPRRIREFDEARRLQDVRDRLSEANLKTEDIELIMRRNLSPESATTLIRMISQGVQLDAALSAVCDFFPTKGTAAVDRFLADPEMRTLVLAGHVGTGKSVAAGYVLRRRSGLFLTCSELTEVARFGDANDARRALAFKTPLLVIDDAGLEKDWVTPMVESLVVERHNDRLRTVLTCNMDGAAFASRYKDRVADRVATCGMFVPLLGDSLRARRAR
jgi:hypothetical protein